MRAVQCVLGNGLAQMSHWRERGFLGRGLMPRLLSLVLVALLLPANPSWSAEPLKGVALVIGNGDYGSLPKLANPANDARAIEAMLDGLGFDTTVKDDRDLGALGRDLERFVEDAADASVAVLYYSGHGIEAGGEDYLVPIDADLSALGNAGDRLVPISALIARLKATVPVTIVMLDACRDNPFGPGAVLRASPASQAVPIGAAGLGETRGAVSLPQPDAAPLAENIGTVIAFAAEPGKAALDGVPGANSPYATAVLRHLGALADTEFCTVMRMVAEEVYLKTDGRQRPWINESLRRLLYFGKAPAPVEGEEGDILRERRRLLITIADLPGAKRKQIETVAADGGVPMDALYGMLRVLGADTPEDPAELDRLLRSQADRLKEIMAERAALGSADPEIQRLSKLADEAVSEGALETAIALNERAKVRLKALEQTLDRTETELKARRIEAAEVYARSAAAYDLTFDYEKAAEDYRQAFRQVAKWDDRLAWKYKNSELLSLTSHGDRKGDNAALERAIAAGREAAEIARPLAGHSEWTTTQNNLSTALTILGDRERDTARLDEAVAGYRALLEEYSRESAPLDWAMTHNNIGTVLSKLGQRDSGNVLLEEAVAAYRAALEEYTRERVPLDWAMTNNNLGAALFTLGQRDSGTQVLEDAVAAYRAALQEYTRERAPLMWGLTQNNLANALQVLGEREPDTARLREAVDAYRATLEERTRERVPLQWAETEHNLGSALLVLGERESAPARMREAVEAYRAALEERTRERVPLDWAVSQNNLGNALQSLGVDLQARGRMEEGAARLEEAVVAYRAALAERTRERVPLDWAMTNNNLGNALSTLAESGNGIAQLEEAVAAYDSALQEWTRERVPLLWATAQGNLGNALFALGLRENGTARLSAAVAAFRASLEERTRERVPLDWGTTQSNLGRALAELGWRSRSRDMVSEGRTAIGLAREVYRAAGYGQYEAYFADLLAQTDRALAQMQ